MEPVGYYVEVEGVKVHNVDINGVNKKVYRPTGKKFLYHENNLVKDAFPDI